MGEDEAVMRLAGPLVVALLLAGCGTGSDRASATTAPVLDAGARGQFDDLAELVVRARQSSSGRIERDDLLRLRPRADPGTYMVDGTVVSVATSCGSIGIDTESFTAVTTCAGADVEELDDLAVQRLLERARELVDNEVGRGRGGRPETVLRPFDVLDAGAASTGPTELSVALGQDTLAIAARSASGTCFRVAGALGADDVHPAPGEPCTGDAAATAAASD